MLLHAVVGRHRLNDGRFTICHRRHRSGPSTTPGPRHVDLENRYSFRAHLHSYYGTHRNVDDLSSHADAHTRSINDQRKVGQTPQLQPRNREIYDAPRIVGFPGQSLPLVGGKEGLGGDVALLTWSALLKTKTQAGPCTCGPRRTAWHCITSVWRADSSTMQKEHGKKEKSHRGGQLDRRAVSPVGGEDGTPPRRKIPALFVCGCGDGIQSLDEREGGGHCGWTKDKMMDDSAACRNSRWGDKALWNYSVFAWQGLVQDLVTIKKSSGCLAVNRAHKLARENHWHSQEGVRASSQHGRSRGQQELVRTDTMGKSVGKWRGGKSPVKSSKLLQKVRLWKLPTMWCKSHFDSG
ncbi:hypothetical protein A9K55_004506 [Cordyceps militaris]|uniref:Uncharacterized protein n=1 Tax=Cordyceps militaris TaxID=73501 RepID=A0A2H4SM31_CORMI|nr:hypothetical protein A9K55_004506 [Cordyceps militaris]